MLPGTPRCSHAIATYQRRSADGPTRPAREPGGSPSPHAPTAGDDARTLAAAPARAARTSRAARRRRIPPETFVRIGRRAGLLPVARHDFLPYQYFVVLARRR